MTNITLKSGKTVKAYKPFDPNRPRISFGNRKTGFPSVNFLAGNSIHPYDGARFSEIIEWFMIVLGWNICGTCPCDCKGCYAKKITRYANAFYMYAMNTYEMTTDPKLFWCLVAADIDRHKKAIANRGNIIRIDDSGDLYSLENVLAIMDFVREFSEIRFYGYTEFHAWAEMLNTIGNVNFRKSHFTEYVATSGHGNAFVDNGTDERIMKMVHCPAIDKAGKKTGKTCNKCNICPLSDCDICFTLHA